MDEGEAGKVESGKESKERRIKNRHHCVTAGEGALNTILIGHAKDHNLNSKTFNF